MDDTAVAPVWNARARSSFLIAQAMRPRGFSLVSTMVATGLLACVFGALGAELFARGAVIDAQAETIALVAERADLADRLVARMLRRHVRTLERRALVNENRARRGAR